MARPRKTPAPVFDHRDAAAAARFVAHNRMRAGDPERHLLPDLDRPDDDDFAAVLAFCEAHPCPDVDARAAELRARATLWAYLDQQATQAAERGRRRRERQLYRLLVDGHGSDRPASWYGQPLGLTAGNVYATRRALERRAEVDTAAPEHRGPLTVWLRDHRDALAEIGEELVDHRGDLLALVADERARDATAERIDAVGSALTAWPELEFAELVAAAWRTWWAAAPVPTGDPVLRDLDSRARLLCLTYDRAAQEAFGGPAAPVRHDDGP